MATPAISLAPAHGAEQPRDAAARRIPTIDALRGWALAMMGLAHTAWSAHLNFSAEVRGEIPFHFGGWFAWTTTLIAGTSPLMFWFLSGTGIGFMERRARPGSGSVTRFLLVRALLMMVINLAVIGFLWSYPGRIYTYAFDVLSCLAVSMAIVAVVRRVEPRVLLGGCVTLILAVPALRAAFPLTAEHPAFLHAVWLHFSLATVPHVWYPVLSWLPVMGLGYVSVLLLPAGEFERPRFWRWAGLLLLVTWAIARSAGPYFNRIEDVAAPPLATVLTMSFQPPSISYLAWNLGWCCLGLAWFAGRADRVAGLKWFVDLGRAPMLFFVCHFAVYRVLVLAGRRLPGDLTLLHVLVLWIVGLTVLIPLARAYVGLRSRHPDSILKYL